MVSRKIYSNNQIERQNMPNQPKELRFYRPNKENKGVALAFQLSYKPENRYENYILFIKMAKQIPSDSENAKFDWEKCINFKCGELDIGEILAVIKGRKQSVGTKNALYHKTANGNKILSLQENENGYDFGISAQDNEKNSTRLYCKLSHGDVSLLTVLLERTIEIIFNW